MECELLYIRVIHYLLRSIHIVLPRQYVSKEIISDEIIISDINRNEKIVDFKLYILLTIIACH